MPELMPVVRRSAMMPALGLLLALSFLGVLACSGAGDDGSAPQQTVVLREWAVTKSLPEVAAGDVSFRVRNNGSLEHNLIVVRTILPPGDLPVDTANAVADVQAAGEVVAEIPAIDRSEESNRSFQLAAGSYVLLCNIPGHYSQGMSTSFTVSEPAG